MAIRLALTARGQLAEPIAVIAVQGRHNLTHGYMPAHAEVHA